MPWMLWRLPELATAKAKHAVMLRWFVFVLLLD